ncbi:MAG: carboxypeptidase-like regulatory domain-containing protein [Flavobacteriales bacterium]
MKLFISFIFVVLSITALKAQSLKGSITDSVSGESIPMAFVVVKLQDSVITQVFSDSDGSYAVDTITPGKYDIEVYFAGYIGKKNE